MNRSDIKKTAIWAVLMIVFFVQMLFYTWCRVQCVQVGYEISKETDRHRKLIALQKTARAGTDYYFAVTGGRLQGAGGRGQGAGNMLPVTCNL